MLSDFEEQGDLVWTAALVGTQSLAIEPPEKCLDVCGDYTAELSQGDVCKLACSLSLSPRLFVHVSHRRVSFCPLPRHLLVKMHTLFFLFVPLTPLCVIIFVSLS